MKRVKNAAERSYDQSYDCLVECLKSRFSELLFLFNHGEELQAFQTERSADQEDRMLEQQCGASYFFPRSTPACSIPFRKDIIQVCSKRPCTC